MKTKKPLFIVLISLILVVPCFGQPPIPNTLTPAEKIYGLARFWQEVNYNFAYINKIDKTMWDEKFKEFSISVQKTENDYEYYLELQRFSALLKDGHTAIYKPDNIPLMTTYFNDFQMHLKCIDGKAIVSRISLNKIEEIPLGSEIIEVNGLSTQQYIDEKVAPYISQSTPHFLQDVAITLLLQGFEGDSYAVKIKKPNNTKMELLLTHLAGQVENLYLPLEQQPPLFEFKPLDNNIAYIALNSFNEKEIVSMFEEKLPELYNAKALIVDLRNNGGGSETFGFEILKYLTNDTVFYGKGKSRATVAAMKAAGTFITEKDTVGNFEAAICYLVARDEAYQPVDFTYPVQVKLPLKRVVLPTVFLIGHYTASAAEDFLVAACNQSNITKIGELTAGTTGQPYFFSLPGGGRARICTKSRTYPDGREFVGIGIKPDIEVKQTVQDFINKNDAALNKAVEYLKQKIK